VAKRANQTSKGRTQEQIAMTVRLPAEVHEALRTVAFSGGTSINDVVVRAVGDFLADKGRREAVDAMATRVREQYRVALDKLKDL
jgi:hypothetical protein